MVIIIFRMSAGKAHLHKDKNNIFVMFCNYFDAELKEESVFKKEVLAF